MTVYTCGKFIVLYFYFPTSESSNEDIWEGAKYTTKNCLFAKIKHKKMRDLYRFYSTDGALLANNMRRALSNVYN